MQVARSDRTGRPGAMDAEARLLRAAGAAGVPVPPVLATGSGTLVTGDEVSGQGPGASAGGREAPVGAWMVTGRLPGEVIARRVLEDPSLAGARSHLAVDCGRALAAIHSLAPGDVAWLDDADQVDQFGALLHAMSWGRPALELALRRLQATRPPPSGQSLVHGDFRIGNLLVDPDGLRAVLDWELAHIGDPLEDLGWFCVRAWRFGMPGRAGGFADREQLLDAYSQASGRPVDRRSVDWWEAVGTFKWAVMCMVQAASHLSGTSRSVELATIGRRVCENEWDLLCLLGAIPRDEPPDEVPEQPVGEEHSLFGRPSAGELLDAVHHFVSTDVVDATEGRVRYHARVAATALSIVRRQLRLGSLVARRHRDRLDALGYADDDALVEAIRRGDCDDPATPVADALASSVRDQLLVANPRHLQPDG